MLPNFICVGAQKAGTTSLYEILKRHSEIFVPEIKETHFFDDDVNFKKGISYYESFFEGATNEKIVAEFTPDYLFYGYVPERIKKILGPEVKILIILRHPVSRAYSQFNFYKAHGVEAGNDFIEAITQEKINRNCLHYNKWHYPPYYLSRSMYYDQVKRYKENFRNVKIVVFGRLFNKQHYKTELQGILEFLGVNTDYCPEITHVHSTKLKTSFTLFREMRRFRSLKKIIPLSLYQRIRNNVLDLLQKEPPQLSTQIKKELFYEYFFEEANRLESEFQIDTSIWR